MASSPKPPDSFTEPKLRNLHKQVIERYFDCWTSKRDLMILKTMDVNQLHSEAFVRDT